MMIRKNSGHALPSFVVLLLNAFGTPLSSFLTHFVHCTFTMPLHPGYLHLQPTSGQAVMSLASVPLLSHRLMVFPFSSGPSPHCKGGLQLYMCYIHLNLTLPW